VRALGLPLSALDQTQALKTCEKICSPELRTGLRRL